MNFPVIIQMYASENGLTTLAMMLAYYKKYVPLNELRDHCSISRNGTNIDNLCKAATYFSLDTKVLKIDADTSLKQKFPFVVTWNKRNYAIITGIIRKKYLSVVDSYRGNFTINIEKFYASYNGKTIIFTPSPSFEKSGKQTSTISYLYNYTKGFHKYIIFTILFTSIVTISNSTLIHLQKKVLDYLSLNSKLYKTYILILINILLIILVLILNCLKTKTIYNLNHKKSKFSINKLLKKIINLPLSFFEKSYNCELLERLDTTITIDNLILNSFIPRLINCFTTLIYLLLMLNYNIYIALICFSIEILYSFIIIRMQNKINIIQRSTTVSSVSSNSILLNGLDTLKTIKSNGSEREYFSLWSKYQSQYEKNRRRSEIFSAKLNIITSLHNTLTTAAILFVGSYFIINGDITLSILSAFQILYSNMHNSVSSILNMNSYIEKIRNNIERINDINNEKEVIKIPLSENESIKKLSGKLKIENLSFGYNSADKTTINNINFEAAPGELIALIGPSGCGKSTLLKNLSGAYKPKSGKIYYDDILKENIPDIIFHTSVASIEQNPIIFDGTIRENIKLFNDNISDEYMINATKQSFIYDRIMLEKDGFDTIMKSSESKFSGGEIQRIELARALSISPTILLLDEFTSALDTITEEKIFNMIRNLGKTCIIAAHRLSTIKICDKILIMNNGKIEAIGTHTELYNNNELYNKLINS